MTIQINRGVTILIVLYLVFIASSLKTVKNSETSVKTSEAKTSSTPVSIATKIQNPIAPHQEVKQKAKQKSDLKIKKKQKITEKVKEKQLKQEIKKQIQEEKVSEKTQEIQKIQKSMNQYQLTYKIQNNKCFLPIKVDQNNYSLGLTARPSQISWIFTSLTKAHKKCDKDNSCDDIQQVIQCGKKDKDCKQAGNNRIKATKQVQGDKNVLLTYYNNEQLIKNQFLSADKAILSEQYEEIQDFVGVRSFNSQSIAIKHKEIIIYKEMDKKQAKIDIRDIKKKQAFFKTLKTDKQQEQQQQDSNKQKQQKQQSSKTEQVNYKKVQFTFNREFIFELPKELYSELTKILKKQYLPNGCKLYSGKFKCSKDVEIPKDQHIQLCLTPETKLCLLIKIEDLIKKSTQNDKKLDLLFKAHEQSTQIIILGSKFAQNYEIIVEKGQVTGLNHNQIQSQAAQQSHKDKTIATVPSAQPNQQKSFSKSLLFLILVYGGLGIGVLLIIKMKARQSIAATAIDLCLEVTWQKLKKIYNQNQGYNPPIAFNQDRQHIDYQANVVVGYSEKQGKELFWQKNSIEGI